MDGSKIKGVRLQASERSRDMNGKLLLVRDRVQSSFVAPAERDVRTERK
jgi:hypothetical protein